MHKYMGGELLSMTSMHVGGAETKAAVREGRTSDVPVIMHPYVPRRARWPLSVQCGVHVSTRMN